MHYLITQGPEHRELTLRVFLVDGSAQVNVSRAVAILLDAHSTTMDPDCRADTWWEQDEHGGYLVAPSEDESPPALSDLAEAIDHSEIGILNLPVHREEQWEEWE